MKRQIVLVIAAIILAGLVLLGASDTDISLADTGSPSKEVSTPISKATDSSSSGSIMITMYTGDCE